MNRDNKAGIARAFQRIPAGLYVLTAEHDEHRMGTLVSFVQRVSREPAMVSVAVPKGESILPLISESRHFGLCQIPAADRVMRRKFAPAAQQQGGDPFLGLEMSSGLLPRVPVLTCSLSYIECELMRHMDVEGDHDLFIGLVKAAGGREGKPYLQPMGDGPQDEPQPPQPPAPDAPSA